jgi:large subunit ribosomal protein L34e
MIKRVHYRKKNTYHTKSNVVRKVKTPGSNLVYQLVSKRVKGVTCGDTKEKLNGIPKLNSGAMHRLAKTKRTVKRPYGGTKSGNAVRDRIVRAFLIEEVNLIKRKKAEKKAGDKKGKGKKKPHNKAK